MDSSFLLEASESAISLTFRRPHFSGDRAFDPKLPVLLSCAPAAWLVTGSEHGTFELSVVNVNFRCVFKVMLNAIAGGTVDLGSRRHGFRNPFEKSALVFGVQQSV